MVNLLSGSTSTVVVASDQVPITTSTASTNASPVDETQSASDDANKHYINNHHNHHIVSNGNGKKNSLPSNTTIKEQHTTNNNNNGQQERVNGNNQFDQSTNEFTNNQENLLNLQQLQQRQQAVMGTNTILNGDSSASNGGGLQLKTMSSELAMSNGNHLVVVTSAEDNNQVDTEEEDNLCLLCNSPFNLLLHKRFICKVCALSVCRNCSLFDDPDWICTVCDQQRAISSQLNCQSWLCKRIKSPSDKELVHLVNAKLRFESERTSRNSSTTTNEAPFLDIGHNQLEHLIALRSDVELIIVKLLGIESIDYAHVGQLFDDVQYSDLVESYTETLANLLCLLQKSIFASQSGKEPSPSPTEAYSQLKDLLSDISEKSFLFTPLRPILRLELEQYLRNCATYEHLLANSIVNQIVEVSQTRFLTASTPALKSVASSSVSGHYSPISSTNSFGRIRSSCSGGSLYAHSNESAAGSDVAHKLDDYSSLDSYSRANYRSGGKMNSCEDADEGNEFDDVDEIELEVDPDEELECTSTDSNEYDFDVNLDFDMVKVNFPEAGVDLVDIRKFPSVESDLSQDSGIKLIDNSSSWQDNWLFKKHKENKSYHQYHLNSDIHYGYMALALSDPVPMLIPNPSQPFPPLIGESEVDEISDLSEHNSETGSVEDLFSDLDESEGDEETEDAVEPQGVDDIDIETATDPKAINNATPTIVLTKPRNSKINLSKAALLSHPSAKLKRWCKIKVPDFVPSELRTICSLIPNSHQVNLEYVPSITLKPANASIHSGIVAQFCCKANGLMPLYFAWYKDGQLIACSDDSLAADSIVAMEENEETKQKQLARIYFGVRFTHRRTVEGGNNSSYRLIVFNDNECILEIKKTSSGQAGNYSVVAYNHAGYDWADFQVSIDRAHYSASVAAPSLSPRPVRRRPQNKPRKSLVATVIEQQQMSIINHLVKAVNNGKLPVPRPHSTTPIIASISIEESITATFVESIPKSLDHIPNFKQRTWKEREQEEMNHAENGYGTIDETDHINGDLIGQEETDEKLNRTSRASLVSSGPTLIYDSNNDELTSELKNSENSSVYENGEPILMEIAEREHRKWLHPDVELMHNPYTAESIEQRAKQMLEQSSMEDGSITENGNQNGNDENEEDEEDVIEKKKFFSDRDIARYKRDYYLPKNMPSHVDSQVFSILNTLGGASNGKARSHLTNSLGNISNSNSNLSSEMDELEYESELKHHKGDISTPPPLSSEPSLNPSEPIPVTTSEPLEISPSPPPPTTPLVNGTKNVSGIANGTNDIANSKPTIIGTEVKTEVTASNNLSTSSSRSSLNSEPDLPKSRPLKDQVLAKLPSVKNLVNLFSHNKDTSSNNTSHTNSPSNAPSTVEKNNSTDKNFRTPATPVRNANNYKVHSLTARSMPREFREQTQKQLPRTTNRISLSNELLGNNNKIVEQNESDSSIPNSLNNTESCTSDENSSSSTNSSLSNGTGREIASELHNLPNGDRYRPILQRAHYWEKRMEEGLASDQKVKSHFPAMDGSAKT